MELTQAGAEWVYEQCYSQYGHASIAGRRAHVDWVVAQRAARA